MTGINIDSSIKLEKDLIVETPVLCKAGVYSIGEIGAFTYTNGRLFSKNVKSIGRYCSIAPEVILGHYTHPTNAISHHNVFYSVGEWMNEFHNYTNEDFDVNSLNKKRGTIEIENDVWIGARAFIMNGVNIGDGAIVAAGSIVTHDVPPYAIVGGNPAKVIKYRYSASIIKMLLDLKWWEYGPEILSDANLVDITECIYKIQERIVSGFPKYESKKFLIHKDSLTISKL